MRISFKGWIHDDIGQHIQDNFGERWTDRFLRLGMFLGFGGVHRVEKKYIYQTFQLLNRILVL